MPSFELQLDNIAQIIKTKEKHPILFSTLDVRCAYLQIPLEIETRKHCNFSIIGGHATGTYQFQIGLYGVTDMLAGFQKAIDLTITNCDNILAYLDDILIATRGSKEEHKKHLRKILTKLNDKNLANSIENADSLANRSNGSNIILRARAPSH